MEKTVVELINYIKNTKGGVSLEMLLKFLRTYSDLGQEVAKSLLRNLFIAGVLRKGKNIRISSRFLKKLHILSGKISLSTKGYGFVSTGSDLLTSDVFIPPGHTFTALNSDIVVIILTEQYNAKGPVGSIIAIKERITKDIYGQLFINDDNSYSILPIISSFPKNPELLLGDFKAEDLISGMWIIAELLEWKSPESKILTKLVELSECDSPLRNVLNSVILQYNLPAPYCKDDLESSEKLKLASATFERKDLTDKVVITVDPFDAKDFDDAISIIDETDTSISVGIHIADVASYITRDSYFDKIASKRGYTNYLPGSTIPMLPSPFVSDIASLIENQEKPAHTVVITIDKESGEVLKSKRFHSVIKVKKRLNFDQVQEFIEINGLSSSNNDSIFEDVDGILPKGNFSNPDIPDLDEVISENLLKLIKLYKVIRKARAKKEAFISLDSREIRVVCSENPPVIKGFKQQKQNESSMLIEEYMLLANSAVAEELIKRKIPGLFRINAEPPYEDLELFRDKVKAILGRDVFKSHNRKKINKLFKMDMEKAIKDIIVSSFLRAMQRAQYSVHAGLHYGLGKTAYSHFTSPIRRYSDLIVHQQLWAVDNNKSLIPFKELESIALEITTMEARYDEAYWMASDKLKLFFLNNLLLEGKLKKVEATVSDIKKIGIQLYISEIGMMGTLPYSSLNEYFIISKDRTYAYGKQSGKKYSLGDSLFVKIKTADPFTTELILEK